MSRWRSAPSSGDADGVTPSPLLSFPARSADRVLVSPAAFLASQAWRILDPFFPPPLQIGAGFRSASRLPHQGCRCPPAFFPRSAPQFSNSRRYLLPSLPYSTRQRQILSVASVFFFGRSTVSPPCFFRIAVRANASWEPLSPKSAPTSLLP